MTKREGVYIFFAIGAILLTTFAMINLYVCWQLDVEATTAIIKTVIVELLLSIMFILASIFCVLFWQTDDDDNDDGAY